MNVLEKEGKTILLGNEAIVRGALESGVEFASTFPGTPSSEIGDTFAKIAKETGIYFEYSPNEKVALEAALGASLSGLKSIVSMKHFGLNVAIDSFLPSVYVNASNFVLVVADDPNCWSSAQAEEDSRYYAYMANVPLIEPSSSQECKDFTKLAFEISEKFKTPVIIRLTTRIDHESSIVALNQIRKGKKIGEGKFIKDEKRFYTLAPRILEIHKELLEKLEQVKKYFKNLEVNKILEGTGNFGIITSGVSFNYIMEILQDQELKIPVLKLGITYPLDEKKIESFLKNKKTIFIVEELDPILENAIRAFCQKQKIKIKILGKEYLPRYGELNTTIIEQALDKIGIGVKTQEININKIAEIKKKLPRRFPVLCAGCPHRSTFYAIKNIAPKETIFAGDIGCYMLGLFPPLKTLDFVLDMGAGIGVAHGIKKSTKQKVIAFIGDSTFFHAGIPALTNMVFNKSNALVVIMDNKITAMTGHQPHPGLEINIKGIVKALGVKNIRVVDPYNFNELKETIKKFLDSNELSVIITRRECIFLKIKKEGMKNQPKFEITDKCKNCKICLDLGCPAIEEDEQGKVRINPDLCFGCGLCSQICPVNAIKAIKSIKTKSKDEKI